MKTYYNEFDPKAAAWLRELITGGHIPAGDVDTRSIVDVKPEDLYGYDQCHFFAGIGGWAYALQLAGWSGPVWTGSCPCQPFSIAGAQRGTADERHLWPQFARLIAECRPPVVFGEQVASKAGRDWLAGVRADLEGMAYAVGAADLCAAGVGSPHIRQRLFWVADADSPRLEGRRRDELSERASERAAGAHGGFGGVADDWSRGREVEVQQSRNRAPEDGGRRKAVLLGASGLSSVGRPDGRLEHAPGDGRVERGPEPSGRGIAGGREPSGVAHPHQGECGRVTDGEGGEFDRQTTGREQGDSQPEPCSKSSGVEESGSQLQRRVLCGPREGAGTAGERASNQSGGSSGTDFWSDYELIPCRDGKVRRIEPGTFPLAHGVSGRVGLLRGYGNAIVPQVAAEFVSAFREG